MTTQDRAREAGINDIVSQLYRRFKDWSKQGFGPDDVTWCEVKADVERLIDAFLAKSLEGADEKLAEIRERNKALGGHFPRNTLSTMHLWANELYADNTALLTLVTALSAKLKEVEAEVARPHLCENAEMQSYTGTVEIMPPEAMRRSAGHGICVDVCLALEVTRLWSQGIKTTGCCCGHGRQHGYIGVTDECIPAMQALGYQVIVRPEAPERLDSFYPKTKLVNYEQLQSDLTATRNALEEEREIVKWLERKPAEVHCDFKCGYGKHGNKDECHCGFADWEASRPSPQVKP